MVSRSERELLSVNKEMEVDILKLKLMILENLHLFEFYLLSEEVFWEDHVI